MRKEQLSSENNRRDEGIKSVALRNMSLHSADGHINLHTSSLPPSPSSRSVVK